MIGVRNVSVRFGPTVALKNVTMEISPGTIHALAGENGSGKSTLFKVLGGVIPPSEGTVTLNDHPVTLNTVRDGLRHGIGVVYQELSLFPHLSGYSNIAIGQETVNRGLVNDQAIRQKVHALVERVHFPSIDFSQPVGVLSIAEQQMIEILKCLYRSPEVILFDEPTASLTRRESASLLQAMRNLRDAGYTIAFVSHHLDEVFQLADAVSVLRDGELVLTRTVAQTTQEEVLSAMLGRTLQDFYPARHGKPSANVLLSLRQVWSSGLEPVTLDVYKGEILGIAGAVGSGANVLADVMAGRRPISGGHLAVEGKAVTLRRPADALRAGIGYVPEDRRAESLFHDLSVATNGTMPLVAAPRSPLVAGGFLRRRAEHVHAERLVHHLGVRTASSRETIDSLSGGNQQKVIIGRWFLRDVPCLVLNNPTKGIDVGAKHEIYRYIHSLADSQHAVIFVSTYNDELLGVADRIAVMYQGRLLGPFQRTELDEERLLRLTIMGSEASGPNGALAQEGGQHGI